MNVSIFQHSRLGTFLSDVLLDGVPPRAVFSIWPSEAMQITDHHIPEIAAAALQRMKIAGNELVQVRNVIPDTKYVLVRNKDGMVMRRADDPKEIHRAIASLGWGVGYEVFSKTESVAQFTPL